MKTSSHIFSHKEFISIVVSSFYRPDYLKKCIESIHAKADMPFELIITDDGSTKEIQEEIFKLRDKTSTILFNTGMNMGLNVSANRAVSVCNSEYILFMNDDCTVLRPCFREITQALSKPFIGWVSPPNEFKKDNNKLDYNKEGHFLTSNITGGYSIAFRKNTWADVGGWCENNTTGQSDNVFITRMIKAGYFKGSLVNGPVIEAIHPGADGYKGSYSFTGGYDCCYPKMFGPGMSEQRLKDISHFRREYCQHWVDGERTIAEREKFDNRQNPTAGMNDLGYWGDYMTSVVNTQKGIIDWTAAQRHGQETWRLEVERCLPR